MEERTGLSLDLGTGVVLEDMIEKKECSKNTKACCSALHIALMETSLATVTFSNLGLENIIISGSFFSGKSRV